MRAYAAIGRWDLEGFLAIIDPEVEFNSLLAEMESTSYRGHAGVREWWDRVRSSLGGIRYEVEEFRDVGPDLALMKVHVEGTVDGVTVPTMIWQAVRARDELVVWWGIFRTEQEALDALAGQA